VGNLVKRSVLILILLQGLPVFGAQTNTFTVVRVIDGDTCALQNGTPVRYLGINAPESGDPQFNEATQANSNLVVGKEVRLEPQDPSRDKEDRLLAYVFVDEVFVNEELLRLGYAHIQRPLVAKYRDRLLRTQEAARQKGLGIWAKAAEQNVALAEAHADAEGNDWDNLCDEYIVIENRDNASVDLTGWTVYDEAHHRYLFPSFILKAKAAVTLRTCLGKNTQRELFWGSRSPIWNNDGDTIFIRDSKCQLVLSYIY
jgi:micrococcal nuclease